jgi:hypothetical protein
MKVTRLAQRLQERVARHNVYARGQRLVYAGKALFAANIIAFALPVSDPNIFMYALPFTFGIGLVIQAVGEYIRASGKSLGMLPRHQVAYLDRPPVSLITATLASCNDNARLAGATLEDILLHRPEK